MLKHLSIKNVAVIEEVNIDFSAGLSVLTGETGAGKSIIIDSINLLKGERASKSLIRSGATKARVDGVFETDEKTAGKIADIPQATVLALDALESALRGIGAADVTVISANDAVRNLRFYHYTVGTTQYYMLTNEGIHDPVQAKIRLAAFGGGAYAALAVAAERDI